MAHMEAIENFEAARKCLQTSLEKSTAIASALDESGSRLELLNQRFRSLEDATSVQKCSLVDIGDHIDTVLCSAAAVLKVFEAVHELEESFLAHPTCDLCTYISNTKKLEEALKLLTDNSRLVLGWLHGVFEFLLDKTITNERCVLNVRKSLRILQELKVMEEGARGDGGLLTSAFDRLETEFHRLLMENTLPDSVTHKLQAIVERLHANHRLDKCKSIYVEVRGMNARKCAESIDLSYLEMPTAEFEDLHVIGSYIDQWGQHLELAVKHLLEIEYKLCSNVFEKIGQETWMECFAKIAIDTGILSFLQFGSNVAASKNDPIKLLKLLDIFRVLDGLRLKFNQLFNGKACEEIRIVTKDLVNGVVNGAGEIFWQLPAQVKLLRPSSPPTDGSVPRVVSFVTDYCNQLLGDTYRPHLTQVLKIHISWRKEVYEEGIVFTQIYNIIKEIAVNLDAWSKAYEDITLSCLFMMNNHCHFYNLRGTAVGNLMGDSWLRAHEEYKDYYAALYLRNSWENLVPILVVRKDLLSSSVTAQDFVQRLNAFNVAFDERYKKQSNWAISDEVLRENICKHLVEGIVPTYRAYVKNYSLSIENDAKHIKYSAQILENMIRSLFQPKLSKYGRIKQTDLIGKLKYASKQFRSTLNAL
ncbi:exocyst complex component EXO70A1 [Cajanus cajan]|uniref:Exocyst subunit Exo70 family protein n=1 Tax=Cajanus cajan TaxID=3821 RepID=A0A151S6H5_CAJCA|nr:exocyst complex component EXO70A1 [Cajanus cajan]KYP50413.1 Exocyst complex component 7 [Cajanus cajan]